MKNFLLLTLITSVFAANAFAQDPWQRINQSDIYNNNSGVKEMVVFKDTLYVSVSSGNADRTIEGTPAVLLRSGNGDSGDANWQSVTPNLVYSTPGQPSFNALAVSTLGTGFLYMAAVEVATYSFNDSAPVVYRSQNGTNWDRISDMGFGIDALEAHDIIEFKGNIYVSSTYITTSSITNTAVFRASYNVTNTASWTLVYSEDNTIAGSFNKFAQFGDDLYAITDKALLYKTNDGLTWTEATSMLPGFGNTNNEAFTAIAAHNNSLYVGTYNLTEGPQLWKSNDGVNFFVITSPSFTTYTSIFNYAYAISDLNSYAGNLVVSVYRDPYMSTPEVVVLRSTDGNNYIKSTVNFNNISTSENALTVVFKDNLFHASIATSNGENALHRVNLNPCAGIPDAGVVIGNTSLCSTVPQSTTLSVSGASTAIGIEFAWQESNDGGTTWANILSGLGFDSISYVTELITYTKQYRAKVTCTNSAQFVYTNPIQINLSAIYCYCQSFASNVEDSRIDSVSFNSIYNQSTNNCATYTDYSTIKTVVNPDSLYHFSVTAGSCDGAYDRMAKLYIDYNIDGDFDDVNEEVAAFGPTVLPTEIFTYAVVIPSTAVYGETKMRVVLVESSILSDVNPCGSYSYGETEDYNIYILPPIQINSLGTGNYCAGSSFVASYTTDNYLSGNQFKLQISNNVGSFANPVVIGTTVSTTTGTINATLPLTMSVGNYSARIIATNPPSVGDVATFTILPNPNIEGAVFSNSVLTTGGKVTLYKYNAVYRMDVEDEVNINTGGTYTFTAVPFGDYIVQAKPNVNNNPGAYFGGAQLWQNATKITSTCGVNQINKNINTNPYSVLTGQGTISGGVYKGEEYGSGKTNLIGDPIPGVDVSLEQNPGGIIIAVTPTSTVTGAPLGTYVFSNVPSGTFNVKVDLPGIGMSSIHTATISGNQDTTHLDYYVDSNAVYIVPSTVSIAEKTNIMQHTKVYPNPSVDCIYVETANSNEPVEISLYNTFGQVVYTEKTTNNKTKIVVDDTFKQGVYIVKVTQGNIQSHHRIVINK